MYIIILRTETFVNNDSNDSSILKELFLKYILFDFLKLFLFKIKFTWLNLKKIKNKLRFPFFLFISYTTAGKMNSICISLL